MKHKNANLWQPNRRQLLAGGLALGAASALPAPARAQSGELVVSTYGGDWNDNMVKAFEGPAFGGSDLRIVHDLGPAAERKTKLLAERRLPRSSVDVTYMSDADLFELNTHGILSELDLSRLPSSGHIIERFRVPYFVPCIYGGVVILYNPEKIPEPPTSFSDLWNPEYAGRVGVIDALHFNYIYAAALANGGTMSDVSNAFPALLDLKKAVQPRLYPSHQALAAAFVSEEIWISVNYSARAVQWQQEGYPVRWSYPEEGAVFISWGFGIPKRATNVDNAYAYLEAMLQPASMGAISKLTSYPVVVDNADLPDEDRELLEFSPEQIEKMNFVDYEYAAKSDPSWIDWWNKEFRA